MNLLTSLRYLVAFNEHKHFGRAATACHITQPALSNALRTLEQEFDAVIVRRGRNYAGLTPEGERVLATAYVMLREADVLKKELKSAQHSVQGTVRIAAVPTAIPIASRFAAMLRKRFSGICPTVLSLSSSQLELGLEELNIDIGLGYIERMNPASRLVCTAQYIEHYFLVRKLSSRECTNPGSGLSFGPPISWQEASRLPLCLLGTEMHNRSIVDAAFTTAGVAVRPAMETNSIMTLILSVTSGDLCSILPGALVSTARHEHQLEALPLTGPDVRTPIGFISHGSVHPSLSFEAAMQLTKDPEWLEQVAMYCGAIGSSPNAR